MKLKDFAFFILKLSISVVLCYFVWQRIVYTPEIDSNNLSTIFGNINYGYLLLGVLCVFVSYFSACLQWKQLLSTQNVVMTYKKLMRFYLVGSFFNNFMPGNIGGDVKKIYDINKNTEETVGASVSATVLDRLCGFYMLNVLALVVGFLFFWQDPEQRYIMLPSLWIFVAFSLCVAFLFSRRLGKVFSILGGRAKHLHGRFQAFKTGRLAFQLIALSFVTQCLRILSHYFCSLSIGIDIDISWYFYYIPIIALVSALPISLGGFGPRELAAQTLFARVGVGGMEALVAQLLAYCANLAVSLFGAFEFLRKKPQ